MNSKLSDFQIELSEHDGAALKDYLASFDLFAGKEQEGMNYLNYAFRRFMITLEMVPPAAGPDARLLELGATPYFITLLLLRFRGYRLTLANFFREDWAPHGQGVDVLSSARYAERHEFVYDHFNVEKDAFPYSDDEFDLVLFCEILEHLTTDPTHTLCEIHRVLKPGGHLLLTTPNVLAWQNLWRLARGKNIYDQYSGYGVYGRHSREYTPLEIIQLLHGCGFETVNLRLDDMHVHSIPARLLKKIRQHWRDNIFVLARASGSPRYAYPPALYRSMYGVRRVVSPEIVIGEYDEAQLGEGWYPFEAELGARWTSKTAWAYLLRGRNEATLGLEINGRAASLGQVALSIQVGSEACTVQMSTDEWQKFQIPLPQDLADDQVEIKMVAAPTRRPSEIGGSQDARELGVMVRRLWLE